MSLRFILKTSGFLIVPVLVLGGGAYAHAATSAPSVEVFIDQAVPVQTKPNYSVPLAPGSLTLEDVVSAHEKATSRTKAPTLSSTSGMMMSEGLRSVFQKMGTLRAPQVGAQATAPAVSQPQAAKAVVAAPPAQAEESAPASAAVAPSEAPKATPESPAPVAKAEQACSPNVQKWEKTCAEAGYPSFFTGKISGETRTNCTDGSLNDVWVANTCAPPADSFVQVLGGENASAQEPVVAGSCGSAHNVVAEKAPSSGLCNSGKASAVEGRGPWTWVCAGADKYLSETCLAPIAKKTAPVARKAESKEEQEEPGFFGRMYASLFDWSSSDDEPEAAHNEESDAFSVPLPQAEALSPENEFCGVAAETMAYEAPTKNLCRIGSASAVSGNGPWTWSCVNNEGKTSSCKTLSLGGASDTQPATASSSGFLQLPAKSAKPAAETLACGAAAEQPAKAAPSLDLCQGGKAGKVRGVGPWKWTCTKGKQKVSCIAAKAAAPVDGVCGAANGKLSKAVPSKKLCKKGKASIIEGKDSWTWTCMGSDGGKDASCSAPALTPPAEAAAPSPKAMQPQPFVPLAKKAVQSQFLNPDKAAETPEPAKEQPAQSYDKVLLPPASETPANNDTQATPPAAKEAAPAPAAAPDSSTEAASAPDVKVAADSSVPTILFASKAKVFDETGKAALDKLAASMKQTSGMRISLLAYADGTGLTPRAAKQLSLVRALAIRDYLAEKGISESRVDVHAEGANAYTGNPDRVDVRVND